MGPMTRYRISAALTCAAMLSISVPASAGFDITEITIAETQRAIGEHRVSCHQVIGQYLERIRSYDQSTHLNSLVLVNPNALAEADQFDAEFKRTQRIQGLQCIGVIVKDNYDTQDLQTTGGSLAMKWFVPATDAFMVQRIRAAGAIILAKSNMAEWAFSPYETVSSIAGITRNPYNLDYVPAGSSGGTAAAVAANFGAVGLGTDTGNSIRGPSSHNALVGIRPTIGLTSRDGIIPLFLGADVGGPIVRTVEDAAALLDVVAGYDPQDPDHPEFRGTHSEVLQSVSRSAGAARRAHRRVSRVPGCADRRPANQRARREGHSDLKAQGAKIVDPFVDSQF